MAEISGKLPYGEVGLICLRSCKHLGEKVDQNLSNIREEMASSEAENYFNCSKSSYLIDMSNPRFANGESKITLKETVRGKDVYIIADVGNYTCTYELYGIKTNMGPDEHYQDIKRAISAVKGNARRITVIMPLLYSSRQHKRKGRESLDCALALQELARLGIDKIITFDAHDPRVENAIPDSFENLYSTYEIIKTMLECGEDMDIHRSNMMVISPDTGGMDRAIYYANAMGLNVGLFYKRRDRTTVVNGRNPIIKHEYMGGEIAGKDVLIVDDIISSGESVLELIEEVKRRDCNNVYVAVTFALFTEGISKIKEFHDKGLIKKLFATNLTYIPEPLVEADWFVEVDMSHFMAVLINRLNYDIQLSPLFDVTDKLRKLIEK